MTDPGSFWDERYGPADYLYGRRPNLYLVDQSYRLSPGAKVLCVGDGEGRNGVWLAGQVHRVVSVDASPRALQKASRLALEKEVFLSTICADLTRWDWPEAAYDAVVAIYLHLHPATRPAVHRGCATALRPGGLLIIEAFAPAQQGRPSGGPPDPAMLYDAEMLGRDFDGMEIVELMEAETVLDEGTGHHGRAAVVRLVARAPGG
jgi:SAM-dependent methyltransferase